MTLHDYLDDIRVAEIKRLAMLADWQIRELGLDPKEVTAAVLDEEDYE